MKVTQPRGQHDTPVTRGGDQIINVSAADKLAMMARRHFAEQQATAQRERLAEIKKIVRKLKRCCCCWPREFRWPDENDLERLHLLVSELVRRIRRRSSVPLWKSYKAVDDHWHLRLWETLSNLVDRAAKNAPPRPLENYARALTSVSLEEAANRFLLFYSEVESGRRDPSQIKWEQFDELFASVTGKYISRAVPRTSPKSAAYTVFLELRCADLEWIVKHWNDAWRLTRWVFTRLQHPQMSRKLTRFFNPCEHSLFIEHIEQLPKRFAEEKKRIERERDRARKRRK